MNLELEKRFLVLLSITELGGSATKKAVLDNILENDYLDFSDNDLKMLNSRSELIWRNDLAYIRDHLKNDNFIDGNEKNKWKITAQGIEYLAQIFSEIIDSDVKDLKKVTAEALVACSELNLQQYNSEHDGNHISTQDNLEDNFGGTVYSQILARRGQKKFRNGLINRYGAFCLLTNCKIIDLIEAAHIVPFSVNKTHNLNNGLLLRSDIHTLFDLNLIGIDRDFIVHLNPRIVSEYSEIENKQIIFDSDTKPNLEDIEFKWNEFVKHSNLK